MCNPQLNRWKNSKKKKEEKKETLAEPMSLRFAASLIAFCTFRSSLCTSAWMDRSIDRSIAIVRSNTWRTNPNRIERKKKKNKRVKDRGGIGENLTADLAIDVAALLAESTLPIAKLLRRIRLRLQKILHRLHLPPPTTRSIASVFASASASSFFYFEFVRFLGLVWYLRWSNSAR